MTTNPDSGRPYGPDFPIVAVRDWVKSQQRLGTRLGIKRWAAIIGGSLGKMQALQWAIDFPERLGHAVVIAARSRSRIDYAQHRFSGSALATIID